MKLTNQTKSNIEQSCFNSNKTSRSICKLVIVQIKENETTFKTCKLCVIKDITCVTRVHSGHKFIQ